MGLADFTIREARPLPVIILADTSGSMSEHGKIGALNRAVREMMDSFTGEDDSKASIHLAVVEFGGQSASIHQDFAPAAETEWQNMTAYGRTPMGGAFSVVRQMIEDPDVVPSKAYRPTIVLVSDGMPTDSWQGPLDKLLDSPRASKAFRFAMGIGPDADQSVLERFIDGTEMKVFTADEATQIRDFFDFVTMSVTKRTQSANPDAVPESVGGIDDFLY
jgi:uncharacterized protein YegL